VQGQQEQRGSAALGLRAGSIALSVHVLAGATAAFLGALHLLVNLPVLGSGHGPDYGVFWTAGRLALHAPELLYEPEALTQAQQALVSYELRLRPWVYPPTALLVFVPLGLLPFWPSFWIWSLTGIAATLSLAKSHLALPWSGLVLLLLAPCTLYALLQGQVSLLLLPALIGALATLDRRPVLAGVLFGLALAIKPQTVVLLPLALLVGRHIRALCYATATGLALVVSSGAVFGTDLWLRWSSSLSAFVAMADEYGMRRGGVAPYPVLDSLGLEASVVAAGRLILVVAGMLIVSCVYAARDGDLPARLTALVGGSLFCSSYALGYDLVLLAPAAVVVLIAPGPRYRIATRAAAVAASLYWLGPVGPVAFTVAMTSPHVASAIRGVFPGARCTRVRGALQGELAESPLDEGTAVAAAASMAKGA
jgi:hypothetical protein